MVQSFAFYDDIVQKKYLYIYMKIETIRKHSWHIYYTCICAIHIDEIINEYIRKVG